MGQVYIIHFSDPFGHARHYTGFVHSNEPVAAFKRYTKHKRGKGSKFLRNVDAAGITFRLVRVFANQTLKHEKRKKKYACQLCPVCRMERKAGKQVKITFSAVQAA